MKNKSTQTGIGNINIQDVNNSEINVTMNCDKLFNGDREDNIRFFHKVKDLEPESLADLISELEKCKKQYKGFLISLYQDLNYILRKAQFLDDTNPVIEKGDFSIENLYTGGVEREADIGLNRKTVFTGLSIWLHNQLTNPILASESPEQINEVIEGLEKRSFKADYSPSYKKKLDEFVSTLQGEEVPKKKKLLLQLKEEDGVRQVLKELNSLRGSLSVAETTILDHLINTQKTTLSLTEKVDLAKRLENFVEDL